VISIGTVFPDAWGLYRLLWRRGVAVAAVVFAIVGVASYLASRADGRGPALAIVVLGLIGQVFVQGMLVEAVRNVHEGRPQQSVRSLYDRAGVVFPSLVIGSIVYGVGVGLGIVLLIVPGLFLAARWSMFVPLIVLEGNRSGPARVKSNELVKGRTTPVLGTIVTMYIAVTAPSIGLQVAVGAGSVAAAFVGFVCAALSAPFEAHVLTTIYYRLTDPGRPVIHRGSARAVEA